MRQRLTGSAQRKTLSSQVTEGEIKREGFFSGFFTLTLSTVIVKIIGLIYKIPMLGLLGSEGMGYFNSAYEIYALFCVIATSGLPVAMSVMIAKHGEASAQRIYKSAKKIFLALGIVGMATMLAFSHPFAAFLKNEKAAVCIFAIAPTVLFICLCSAYRGYFQGLGSMRQTAMSQVIEALGKLLLGLLFAYIAFRMGVAPEYVAAAGVCGLTLGVVAAAVYLAASRKKQQAHVNDGGAIGESIGLKLLRAAIPITLSSAVLSVTRLIDMSMILRRLQGIGYSPEDAFSAYGSYTTLAVPLFSLAPALITSVALPLIPTLSRAIALGDGKSQSKAVSDALKLTCAISMPLGVGMSLFPHQILGLVFRGQAEAVALSAPLLAILGTTVTSSCLITVGNAVLQAYGKPSIPIFSMAVGAIVKIVLAYILIGNESIALYGAPISTLVCDLVINIINFHHIFKLVPCRIEQRKILGMPFLASLVSIVPPRLVYSLLAPKTTDVFATLVCVAIAAMLYGAACLTLGIIKKKDIAEILGSKDKSEEDENDRATEKRQDCLPSWQG